MEMILYKVFNNDSDGYVTTEYILAISKQTAIIKFMEVTEPIWHSNIVAKRLCKRDDIIPTVEPIEEFK